MCVLSCVCVCTFAPQSLKAVVTPQCLLVLDFRGLGLERWLVLELAPQLAGDGGLATHSLPFEFRALEAILQHRVTQPWIQGTISQVRAPCLS